jgi:hypothetical protein
MLKFNSKQNLVQAHKKKDFNLVQAHKKRILIWFRHIKRILIWFRHIKKGF